MNELTKVEALPVATQTSPFQTTMAIIQSVARDATVDVTKMEKLLEMAFKMEARDAEKQFITAFNRLQSELPTIVASSAIPNRGMYERFEDVMRQIQTPLQNNGFTVSFNAKILDGNPPRMEETCTLSHVAGHSRSNSFTVRISSKADSETQADCKAATTAKRNALLNALNIVIRQDALQDEDDPRNEGEFIDAKTAEELERRVALTNSDAGRFLALAGAKKFSEVTQAKHEVLDRLLAQKERAGK